jgi:4-amino-4-deoxy-L-arabinose transferase-like glycosyltransferase
MTRLLPRDSAARLAILAILCVALIASGLVWGNTRWGVGLRGDSYMYVSGARNLAAGLGYSRISGGGEVKPITHFPPLFSIVLAAFQAVGWDAVSAARGLAIALMGLNTLLAGALAWRLANRPLAGALGAFLFGLNPLFLDVHSWAMAEPLFIALTLGTLSVLPWAAAGQARRALLAGLLAGLACLARYVGAAGIAAGTAVLLWPRRSVRLKLRHAAAFLLASLLPVGAWLLRNLQISGTSTNRQIIWHPIDPSKLTEAGATFAAWLLPDTLVAVHGWLVWVGVALGVVCLVAAAVLLLSAVPLTGEANPGLALSLAWFVFAYTGVLLGNLLLLDSSTPLDARILSPLLSVLTPLLAALIVLVWWRGRVASKFLMVILALLLLTGFADDGRRLLDQGWLRGWGFSHRLWQSSALMQAIRELPPVTLYTNEPDLVYFQTGRPSYIIFGSLDPVTGLPREGYDEWLTQARRTLAQGRAALVLVNYEALLNDAGDRAMVEALSEGLVMIGSYDDGVILSAGE